MQKDITKLCLKAALLASLSAPSLVLAQSGETGAAQLADIVITAERRTTSLQDTPLSVSAITAESLADANVTDTESLSYSVPGLVLQRDVVGKAVIRGIGTENFTVGGDPGVATYVDGAYIARSSTAIFDFFDVERVEVLRGPQGTLYGRNATGGVINVISRAPSQDPEAYVNATYGNYDAMRLEGAISGPVTEGIRVRLAGLYHNRDGFTDNIFPGLEARGLDELDTKDLWALRGRIDFDLGEAVTLELIGDIYRDDSNPPAFWYTDDTLPWQGPNSVFPRDLRTVSQGFETDTPGFAPGELEVGQAGRQDQTGVTARLTWDAGPVIVTSTTAYRDIKFEWINDGDGLSDFVVVYFQRDYSEQFTQDIQIASNTDGPLQWIVGGFYLNEDAEGIYAIPLGGFSTILYDGTNETEAFGVFAEGTYTIGDLSITAGLRYSDETKDATLLYRFPFIVELPLQEQSADFSAVTPRLVIDYQIADDAMVYASVTRGFKSGGFSLLDNPINAFDQETIWAYEAGFKSRLLDRRLQLNGAAFFYDYKDQQLSQVTNLATQTTNAGSSTIWGFELEWDALISDQIRMTGNLAYLNTEFDEFCTVDTRNPALPIDVQNCGDTPNLAGNELPRSPDFTANMAITYSDSISEALDGFLRLEWQYSSSQFFSVFNRDNISQESFSLFNASAGISDAAGRWSVKAWVRNLTDEEYFSNLFESGVVDTVAIPQGFVAPPRTYGLTVGFSY